jgi:energy-coupling factor transporter ATP-binding protein EcfA2
MMTSIQELNDGINEACSLPNGSRFFRCALQVNSFQYLERHGKGTTGFADEAAFNAAMVEACKENNIEVVAVTDHFRIDTAQTLIEALREAGITVFPGFEAATEGNIHFLVLFDPSTNIDEVKARIHRLVPTERIDDESPRTDKTATKLLDTCKRWGAIPIAAHIMHDSGLLRDLSGQNRIDVWTHGHLLACAIPCPVDDMSHESTRQILSNKIDEYERERLPALLFANDVDSPADFAKERCLTDIRMAEPTIEGLRQAFLDPEARVRLPTDEDPKERTEFIAMAWEGGFLDDVKVHFNRDLNVLIGGRGTGKSTVIESLRFVLDREPLGEDAQQSHRSIIKNVLEPGTKVSLLVQTSNPSQQTYLIERTVSNPPVVKDQNGDVLDVDPEDVLGMIEVYGQHEIAEVARDRTKLTNLLDRFVDAESDFEDQKESLQRQLRETRESVLSTRRKRQDIDEQLEQLPKLKAQLAQYKDAGLEQRLEAKTKLVKEKSILGQLEEKVEAIEAVRDDLDERLPLSTAVAEGDTVEDLPNQPLLEDAVAVVQKLSQASEGARQRLETAIRIARRELQGVNARWNEKEADANEEYQKVLRDLQEDDIDADAYVRLQERIEELKPLRQKKETHDKLLVEAEQRRRNLLQEWEDVQQKEYRAYDQACRRVTQQLKNVKVKVRFQGDRSAIINWLDEKMEGRRQDLLDHLEARDQLSLRDLTERMARGVDAVTDAYEVTDTQAQNLIDIGEEVRLELQEIELPPSTEIQLNVAAEGQSKEWRDLSELSTGQRATAVLLLLLLESSTPLVVDQPEDDLDNRFVVEDVVPQIRGGKGHRQLVFATHNANIPVLGDADLILGFSARGDAASGSDGRGEIKDGHRGSIDQASVGQLVKEILEGGKTAFETRRAKYGF